MNSSWAAFDALPVDQGKDGRYWERSGKFEGDIVFKEGFDPRNGVVDTNLRWPDRTLVYRIAPNQFSQDQLNVINGAMQDYMARTCITFREANDNDRDYVYIQGNDNGCYSYVGRIGGQQILNLQFNGCVYHGTAMHEMLHALGFYHQQSATDRDDYVTIMWQNIQSGTEHNFDKYPESMITDFGVRYDYGSVMHYGRDAFSANGQDTIVPLDPNAQIGQSNGLSDSDIEKLERMYGCRK